MTGLSCAANGRHVHTLPSLLPVLQLDRIYVRGFEVIASRVHRGKPWALLSDHLAVSAQIAPTPDGRRYPGGSRRA
ncbi:MAG: hypothetical protein FJY47_04150 [Betaproteobacteria bacterium]|nr:hypothetical protein [Betaproteobacteria bacterium]